MRERESLRVWMEWTRNPRQEGIESAETPTCVRYAWLGACADLPCMCVNLWELRMPPLSCHALASLSAMTTTTLHIVLDDDDDRSAEGVFTDGQLSISRDGMIIGRHDTTTTVANEIEKSSGNVIAPTASATQRDEQEKTDEERRRQITGGPRSDVTGATHIDTTMRPSSSESAGGCSGGERPEGCTNAPRAKVLRTRTDSFDMNSSTVRISFRAID